MRRNRKPVSSGQPKGKNGRNGNARAHGNHTIPETGRTYIFQGNLQVLETKEVVNNPILFCKRIICRYGRPFQIIFIVVDNGIINEEIVFKVSNIGNCLIGPLARV